MHLRSIASPKPSVRLPLTKKNNPLTEWVLAAAHIRVEMPESGTRSPRSLTSAAHRSAPQETPSQPPFHWFVRRGLGQVISAAMEEDWNPATRPEGRREGGRGMVALGEGEEMSWDGERGRGRGGPKTSKTTTITARKQTTREGKKHTQARERRGEQKKLRGTQGPPTN